MDFSDEQNLGGGSGGDTGMESSGNQLKSASGTYQIGGNQVVLIARESLPPAQAGPSRIILLAAGGVPGAFIDDGMVDIRGCKGVRVTTGPGAIPMLSPTTSSEATNGVEILVSETQTVKIQRGLSTPGVSVQTITMEPLAITLNAGTAGTLTLAAGTSSITIGPSGITIIGVPMVNINPGPPAPPLPPDVIEP
jgi:hypothetical protein